MPVRTWLPVPKWTVLKINGLELKWAVFLAKVDGHRRKSRFVDLNWTAQVQKIQTTLIHERPLWPDTVQFRLNPITRLSKNWTSVINFILVLILLLNQFNRCLSSADLNGLDDWNEMQGVVDEMNRYADFPRPSVEDYLNGMRANVFYDFFYDS